MKENKIPSAEDYLKNSHATGMAFNRKAIQEVMIEFAKLHVKAALEAAAENAEATEGWSTGFSGSAASVNEDSILNAYPEELIK